MTTFARTACPSLYQGTYDSEPVPQVWYLLPPDVAGPDSLELATTWGEAPYDRGCYVLVPAALSAGTETAFAAAVRDYLGGAGRAGARLAWVTNAGQDRAPYDGPFVPLAGAVTTATTVLDFRNVQVVLAPGATLTVDGDGFAVAPGPGGVSLTTRYGAVRLPATEVSVPLAGPLAGCVRLQVTIDLGSGLAALDAGLRLFYDDPSWPVTPDPAQRFLASQRYPVFVEEAGTERTLYGSFDVAAPFDRERTVLRFAADGETGPSLSSHYATAVGLPLSLVPRADARLVFHPTSSTTVPVASDALYLTPCGSFAVVPPPAGEAVAALRCGLSGAEYVELVGDTTLTFTPDSPAYARGWVAPTSANPAPAQPGASLDGTATTSWPSVGTPEGTAYCAQPDSSVLHGPPPAAFPATPLLTAARVVAAPLPAAAPPLPMLPYGGVTAAYAPTVAALETQVVSPARRAAVPRGTPGPPGPAAEATGTWGVTPQGLAAQVGALRWDSLVLGQDVNGTRVTLSGVVDTPAYPLYSAMTSNTLMLVVANPAAMSAYDLAATIALTGAASGTSGDWVFDLDPASWRDDTLLVLKFWNRPLAALAADPSAWAAPQAFATVAGTTPAQVSAMLQGLLANATGPLATAATDPGWNGVLAFNAPVTVPGTLAGLMAGIDTAAFCAHHLGLNVTPVAVDPGGQGVTARTTSMFGLVDYTGTPPDEPDSPYDYWVTLLRAEFQNSALTAFASTVALKVDELFGEACAGPPGNAVTLTGVVHDGGYLFSTQGDSTFTVTSGVLRRVDLRQVRFVTVDPGGDGEPVRSTFVLTGTADFQVLVDDEGAAFDVLSFGTAEVTDPAAGLAFGGVTIDLASVPASESLPAYTTYAFDAAHAAVDPAGSTVRPDSLAAHFPLTRTGFVQGAPNTSPADAHYLGVTSPLAQSAVGNPWWGVTFDLELGTLGALAGTAGFTVGLVLAWTPHPDGYAVFLGLRMPGAVGGSTRELDVEGVLKVAFGGITLTRGADAASYVLLLSDIALKLLGATFPPGSTSVAILGNPGGSGPALAWFASYAKTTAVTP